MNTPKSMWWAETAASPSEDHYKYKLFTVPPPQKKRRIRRLNINVSVNTFIDNNKSINKNA